MNRSIQTLFKDGTTSGLSDAGLLDRFLRQRDEAAFEALVVRHGPMVLEICRTVLGDAHAAEDAFQATFLVLSCQARSIQRRDSLASWLFGVARRVAIRAKCDAARRHSLARTLAERPARVEDRGPGAFDPAALHEEVDRLPEKYRAPIVLCYWQGLTYEAAAQQLGCPVGTLSVRLKRAKDRLKTRLTRRGATVPAGLLAAGAAAPASSATFSIPLAEATARAALRCSAANTVVAGAISATVSTLTHGVLNSMALTKLKIIALFVGSLSLVAVSGTTIVGQQASTGRAKPKPAANVKEAPRREDPELAVRRHVVEAARRRMEAQRKFYEEGRITIDRFLSALTRVKDAEVAAARTQNERLAAIKVYVERLEDVETREKAALDAGTSTAADVEEVVLERELADMELRRAQTPNGPLDLILQRLPASPSRR
jgi:RNA polymerase sigma factor (sigma-70 family)